MSMPFFKLVHSEADLASLHEALDRTPHDYHFGKGYRFRSMSRFETIEGENGFRMLDAKPLYQSGAINPIENYGGIYRDYKDLPLELLSSEAFRGIVQLWLQTLPEVRSRFSVHHIRTHAPGSPTPEGRHRDGYEYVGIAVLQRRGIAPDSAVTSLWDRKSQELLFKQPLEEGDVAVFDDRQHLHATSDVQVADGNTGGVRDVLILTVPDHGAVVEGSEVQ